MSLRVPKWGSWVLVASVLGCAGQVEPDADGGEGVLSVERIDGEAFAQIWGSSERLWIAGGPRGPEPVAVEGAAGIQPCPSPNRRPADNILRSSMGQGWELIPLPESPALMSLHGSSDDDVWMVGHDGAALSFDGQGWTVHDVRSARGLEFEEAAGACAELSLHSVFARAPDDVWAVGFIQPSTLGPGLILHYDGAAWRRDAIDAVGGLLDIWASSASDAWAVGSSGQVFHFDGDGWQRVDGKTQHYLFSVLGTGAGDVWATGNAAITTRFDGTEWGLLDAEKPYASRRALAGGADAGLWALENTSPPGGESQHALVRWTGTTWIEASSARETAELNDLWLTPDGQLWGVGGAILRLR
jgi:hypothetical protein